MQEAVAPIAPSGQTKGLPRTLLQAEGLLVFVGAIGLYVALGAPVWMFFVLLLTPDLSMLGYLVGQRAGALAYNAAHTYLAPTLVFALPWYIGWPHALPLALIWAAHIGIDRALGFGLKYSGGFKQTHLS